jgi:hypothetical protein
MRSLLPALLLLFQTVKLTYSSLLAVAVEAAGEAVAAQVELLKLHL